MKFPKLFKRAAAVLMAAVTTLSVLPATTAFAAGDISTISFTHTYDRNGNAIGVDTAEQEQIIETIHRHMESRER